MGETKKISANRSSSREKNAMRSAGIAAAALVVFSPFVELSPIPTSVFAAPSDSARIAERKQVAKDVSNEGIFAALKARDSVKNKDTITNDVWGIDSTAPANNPVSVPKAAQPAQNNVIVIPEKIQPTPSPTGFADSRLYLADSLFEDAGVSVLGAKETKAAEGITWLVSSSLDQHGIDTTVDLYFTGMGVNRKSIMLLGRIADEMRSNKEPALSGNLMRYLKFKNGNQKKGLRPVPHSVFYVAVSLENAERMQRRYIIGRPPQAPVAQTSSLDSMFLPEDTVPIIAAVSSAAPKPPAAVKKPAVRKHIHTIHISPPAEVKADKAKTAAPAARVAAIAKKAPERGYPNLPECMKHLYYAGLAGIGAAFLLAMGMAQSFTGRKRRRHKLAMEAIAAHAASRKQRKKP